MGAVVFAKMTFDICIQQYDNDSLLLKLMFLLLEFDKRPLRDLGHRVVGAD